MAERLTYTTGRQLRALFSARGIRPRRSLGQNFLVDPNLLQVVAGAAELTRDDVVLEIGAGTGSLTEVIASQCGQVVAVEKDEYLGKIARESLASMQNVKLVSSDILEKSGAIAKRAMQPVEEILNGGRCSHFKVAGDLPYSVATPVIMGLIETDPMPELIVATVQLEVAERLVAPPRTKAYGFLSILVQSQAKVELIRKLPPWVYWPSPKVWSALVRIRPLRRPEAQTLAALRNVASALFGQRRKTAANALVMKGIAESKDAAEKMLAQVGVEPSRRADALSVEETVQLARLARHLRAGETT